MNIVRSVVSALRSIRAQPPQHQQERQAARSSRGNQATGRVHPAPGDTDVLVVIDMQPSFATSQKPETVAAVQSEIKQAVKHDEPILYVRYDGCGPTDKRLTALTEGYPHTHVLTKTENDGSEEIVSFLEEYHVDKPHLRVCGVNTDACVRSTVEGLSELLWGPCQIDVLGYACNANVYRNNAKELRKMEEAHFPHVRVLESEGGECAAE